MANEFDQLLPCKLSMPGAELEFPVTNIHFSFVQDLVEHKYVGIDGARVERTGRAPLHFDLTIPLFNGIVEGKTEKWNPSILYPDGFRTLLRFCIQGKTCIFQHPELDQITCRVQSFQTHHSADHRDGVEIIISLLEIVEDGDETNAIIPQGDALVQASLSALDLDASKDDIKKLAPTAATLPFTLESLIDSVTGLFDQIALQSQLQYGKLAQFAYHLNSLGEAVGRAKTSLLWPVTEAIERGKSAAYDARQRPPVGTRPIKLFIVKVETTLAALLTLIPGTSMTDIVKLNPGITRDATVKADTVVRYFAPS